MKKLPPFCLKNLNDLQFIEFVEHTLSTINDHKDNFGLENLLLAYQKSKDLLEEGFQKQKTTLHKQKVIALNTERARIFTVILSEVKGFFCYDTDSKKYMAAEKVFSILKLYDTKKAKRPNFKAESAAITRLLQDLKAKVSEETAFLKLTKKLEALEKVQINFQKTYAEWVNLAAENKSLSAFKPARSFASFIFTTLCDQISVLPITFPEKSKEINILVNYLDVQIIKHRVRVKKKKNANLKRECKL